MDIIEQIEYVVLVDAQDNETGVMEKMQAHKEGALHRAFSVFIFNTRGEMLLQRRADGKYHSPGLWTNTCCSHPRPGEPVSAAAARRLREEMGMESTLTDAFDFVYKADFDNGLTEHEYDHVFTGITDNIPNPDSHEVSEWRYVNKAELLKELSAAPHQFTAWFKICCERYIDQLYL